MTRLLWAVYAFLLLAAVLDRDWTVRVTGLAFAALALIFLALKIARSGSANGTPPTARKDPTADSTPDAPQ